MRGNPTVCYFYSRKQLGNQSIPYNKGLLERKIDMSESSADWSAALERRRQMSKSSPTLRGMVHAERAPLLKTMSFLAFLVHHRTASMPVH
jgi:hypothetical protein